jgi:hypothetical protein
LRGGKVVVQQVAADAFGNALGSSLAGASNGASAAPGDPLVEFFDENMPAWEQRQANFDEIATVFSQAQNRDRSPGVLLADAADVLRLSRPITTDDDVYYANIINALQARDAARQAASASFRAGEARATSVLYGTGAADVRETTPSAPPTLISHSAVGIAAGYFDDSGGGGLAPVTVRSTASPVEAAIEPSFQEMNDQRVIAGTYDRFSEIEQAWSSGTWGDIWRHITFEASPQARDVAIHRMFPPQHPDAIRLQRMANSPIGAMASSVGRAFGADQQRQDALLMTGSLLEQLGGTGSQAYKQTLTAPPPAPGALASKVRGMVGMNPSNPLDVGSYGTQAHRSVRDGMSPDHIPSFAAIRMHMERTLNRALTPKEAMDLRNSTTTLMVDTGIHQQVSRTYGGRNTPSQIARDSLDLQAAAVRDQAVYRESLRARGYSEQQIDAAFERIHAANKDKGLY